LAACSSSGLSPEFASSVVAWTRRKVRVSSLEHTDSDAGYVTSSTSSGTEVAEYSSSVSLRQLERPFFGSLLNIFNSRAIKTPKALRIRKGVNRQVHTKTYFYALSLLSFSFIPSLAFQTHRCKHSRLYIYISPLSLSLSLSLSVFPTPPSQIHSSRTNQSVHRHQSVFSFISHVCVVIVHGSKRSKIDAFEADEADEAFFTSFFVHFSFSFVFA